MLFRLGNSVLDARHNKDGLRAVSSHQGLGFIPRQSTPSTFPHKTLLCTLLRMISSPCFTVMPLYPQIYLTLFIHLLRDLPTLFTLISSLLNTSPSFSCPYHLVLSLMTSSSTLPRTPTSSLILSFLILSQQSYFFI